MLPEAALERSLSDVSGLTHAGAVVTGAAADGGAPPQGSVSRRAARRDLQQVDLRGRNSWRLLLDEVSSVELLRCKLVKRDRPVHLQRSPEGAHARTPRGATKHIVTCRRWKGSFYRRSDDPPSAYEHAKAALNMMTRHVATISTRTAFT